MGTQSLSDIRFGDLRTVHGLLRMTCGAFVLSPQSVAIMLGSVDSAGMRIGRLFAGGCRAEAEDLRESECQELHIGRVTMNLPEFATNYMIQGTFVRLRRSLVL